MIDSDKLKSLERPVFLRSESNVLTTLFSSQSKQEKGGRIMRKVTSLILAIVMIMAVSLTAVAAENACTHPSKTYLYDDSYYTNEYGDCYLVKTKVYRCNICNELDEDIVSKTPKAHVEELDYATCNGYVQTMYYRCNNCHSISDTDQRDCPGSGLSHNGGCRWLPL